jgi:hypothetical protein
MSRTRQALAVLALGLALAGTTTAAVAAPTPPTATHDQTDQRRALYQSELERNLQLRNQRGQELAQHGLAAQRKALYHSELEGTLARRHALGAVAAQPAARTDPATPSPRVDVLATLLVGLIGGMVGGAAAVLGWSATTRRRLPGRLPIPERPVLGRPLRQAAPPACLNSNTPALVILAPPGLGGAII